jgi:hypothetical protein
VTDATVINGEAQHAGAPVALSELQGHYNQYLMEGKYMKIRMITMVAAAVTLAACGRTKDGDLTVERQGDVDVKMTKDTLKMPELGTKIDTINTPVVGTKPETLVVNKPVVGTQKSTVKVPVIRKP